MQNKYITNNKDIIFNMFNICYNIYIYICIMFNTCLIFLINGKFNKASISDIC